MSKKKQVAPEPDPPETSSDEDEDPPTRAEEDEEEEVPVGEGTEDRVRRLKRSRVNERRKARQNGTRAFAIEAGAGLGIFGNDVVKGILSASDVKRLCNWAPAVGDVGVADEDFADYLKTRDEPLTSKPLKVFQANIESFARKFASELVARNYDATGPQSITAQQVVAAARPFVGVLFGMDHVTPLNVVRTAQQTSKTVKDNDGNSCETTVLPCTETTATAIAEERRHAKSLSKRIREVDRKLEARKQARRRPAVAVANETPEASAVATA